MKLKKVIIGILALIGAGLVSSCASRSLETGGLTFRTAGAPYASVGAVGYKNSNGPNIFEPYHRLDLDGIELMMVSDTVQTIDVQRSFGIDVDSDVATANASTLVKNIKAGRYQIFTVLDRDQLMERINTLEWNDRHPFRYKDGRIVTAIVLVYNGEESKYSEYKADLKTADSIKLLNNGMKIELSANGSTTRTIKIADGSVIGYEYCKALFNGQDRIVQLKTDRIGWWVFSK